MGVFGAILVRVSRRVRNFIACTRVLDSSHSGGVAHHDGPRVSLRPCLEHHWAVKVIPSADLHDHRDVIAGPLAVALILFDGGMADLRGKTFGAIDKVDPHPLVFGELALFVIPVGISGGD